MSKAKKYFTFFGILIATVNDKIQSFRCMIEALLTLQLPNIIKNLLSKVLKPVKLYSTNNI